MSEFTYDAESTVLTEEEMAAFSEMARQECWTHERYALSVLLEGVKTPWCETAARFLERQAGKMWQVPVVSRWK